MTIKKRLSEEDLTNFIIKQDEHIEAELNNTEMQQLKEFAYAEQFTRNFSYQNLNENKSFKILGKDGSEESYKVVKLQTIESSLIPYVLVGEDNNKVHLMFRGSKSLASFAIRDLEQEGAGEETYNIEKSLIMSQVNDLLVEKNKDLEDGEKIDFAVHGHSLGGSDAQRGATSVLSAIVQEIHDSNKPERNIELSATLQNIKNDKNHILEGLKLIDRSDFLPADERNGFKSIGNLALNTANSAGVSFQTADNFKKYLTYIKENSDISVKYNALMVSGDGVQTTGQTAVAAGLDKDLIDVALIKIDKGQEGKFLGRGTVAAHTSKHFTSTKPEDLIYELYSNADEQGKELIAKKLQNKWGSIARGIAAPIKKLLNVANRTVRGVYNWCYSWFYAVSNEAEKRLQELSDKIDNILDKIDGYVDDCLDIVSLDYDIENEGNTCTYDLEPSSPTMLYSNYAENSYDISESNVKEELSVELDINRDSNDNIKLKM